MIILSGAGTVTGGSITDPSELDDIWEWWEPSREAFNDNDPIGQLTGQFAPGSGHNWTQSNATLKPTYKTNIVNGHGVARFDGTNDEMANIDPTALTSVHMFVVIKMDSNTPATGKSGIWGLGNISGSVYPRPDSHTQISDDSFRGNQMTFFKAGIDVSQWRVVEVVSNSSEWIFLLDGTTLHTTDGSNFDHQSAGFIRLGRSGPFDGNYLDGDVAGMYICSAKLTTARASMISYLNSRFGLSAL